MSNHNALPIPAYVGRVWYLHRNDFLFITDCNTCGVSKYAEDDYKISLFLMCINRRTAKKSSII